MLDSSHVDWSLPARFGADHMILDVPIVPNPKQRPGSAQRAWVAASSLLGLVVVGIAGGLWLDRRFETAPLWLVVCGLGAVALAMYGLVREARR